MQIALTQVQGSWGLAVLEQYTGRLVTAAHGSPLLIAHTSHGDFATSDINAVAEAISTASRGNVANVLEPGLPAGL